MDLSMNRPCNYSTPLTTVTSVHKMALLDIYYTDGCGLNALISIGSCDTGCCIVKMYQSHCFPFTSASYGYESSVSIPPLSWMYLNA